MFMWAGRFYRVAADESYMGCNLVPKWRTHKGAIFCKANNTINRKSSLRQGCHSK